MTCKKLLIFGMKSINNRHNGYILNETEHRSSNDRKEEEEVEEEEEEEGDDDDNDDYLIDSSWAKIVL